MYLSYRYNTPLFNRKINPAEIKNVFNEIGEIKSCAIIGKGNSIRACNPIKKIQKCDFKIILNRVEVETLTEYIGDTIDAQIGVPSGAIVILPKNLLRKFKLKFILSNKLVDSPEFYKFYNAYRGHGVPICCAPNDSLMKYNFCKYDYPHATQCGSILKVLYNIDSLERIVFAGVDFYRFGYSTLNVDKKTSLAEPPPNNDKLKGDPLMKYIFNTVPRRNEIRPLTAYFPEVLKDIIDFPKLSCFKFY